MARLRKQGIFPLGLAGIHTSEDDTIRFEIFSSNVEERLFRSPHGMGGNTRISKKAKGRSSAIHFYNLSKVGVYRIYGRRPFHRNNILGVQRGFEADDGRGRVAPMLTLRGLNNLNAVYPSSKPES